MTKSAIIEINRDDLSLLVTRIENAIRDELALSVDDMKLLLSAITTLCTLQCKMEQDDVTLNKLRKLLGIIKQSESRSKARKGMRLKKSKKNKGKNKRDRKNSPSPQVIYHPGVLQKTMAFG